MKYEARSEEDFSKAEAEELKKLLLPDGLYDFEVADAEEKQSAKGNDMIVLTLTVYDETGATKKITDYLVAGTTYGERKIRHAAVSTGLQEVYEANKLTAEDFTGRSGKVKIKTQEGTKDYPKPKNVVDDYVEGATKAKKPAPADLGDDSDIPF